MNCGPTHHTGCACHEARRDAIIARYEKALREIAARTPRANDTIHSPSTHIRNTAKIARRALRLADKENAR